MYADPTDPTDDQDARTDDYGTTDRRRFLATVAGAGAAALAGCLGAGGTATLEWTGEEVQLDGRERNQLFGDAAVFTVRQLENLPTDVVRPTPVPFSAVLHHREGLRTDRLRLRLLAPPADGSAFPAAVYLQSPPNDRWPSLSVARDDAGGTVVTADGLGRDPTARGDGPGMANVRLDFVIVPVPAHPVAELLVEAEAVLSEPAALGRRRHRLARRSRFPLVTA